MSLILLKTRGNHSGSKFLEIGMLETGHSLIRSLARSLAGSLAPEFVGQWNIFAQFSMCPESLWKRQTVDFTFL